MLAVEMDRGLDVDDELRFLILLLSVVDVTEKVLSALDLEWVEEGLK